MNHEDAKDTKDLFLYLIGVTDQVNHHALRAIFISLSFIHYFHEASGVIFNTSIRTVTDVNADCVFDYLITARINTKTKSYACQHNTEKITCNIMIT